MWNRHLYNKVRYLQNDLNQKVFICYKNATWQKKNDDDDEEL